MNIFTNKSDQLSYSFISTTSGNSGSMTMWCLHLFVQTRNLLVSRVLTVRIVFYYLSLVDEHLEPFRAFVRQHKASK